MQDISNGEEMYVGKTSIPGVKMKTQSLKKTKRREYLEIRRLAIMFTLHRQNRNQPHEYFGRTQATPAIDLLKFRFLPILKKNNDAC